MPSFSVLPGVEGFFVFVLVLAWQAIFENEDDSFPRAGLSTAVPFHTRKLSECGTQN
jgi:hypothetical protein